VDHDIANRPYCINIYDTQEIVHIVDFVSYEFLALSPLLCTMCVLNCPH